MVAACKGGQKPAAETPGSAATTGSAVVAGSAGSSQTPAKPVDVMPRAQKLVDAQAAALQAADDAALAATFTSDAVVLASGAGHEATADLIAKTVAQASPHDQIKSVKVDKVVAGGNDDAMWVETDLTITKHTSEPGEKEADATTTVHATELATAAAGWKVVAGAFAEPRDARQPGGVFPVPDATSPGPLAALLGNPSQLAAALASDPAVAVVSNDGKVAIGSDAARSLIGTWTSRTLTISDPREVRDAKSGFVQANVAWPAEAGGKPYRATAQVIALPKPDGSWSVVAVQFLAL